MTAPALSAFDRAASGYDAAFTETRLGRLLRVRVWERLSERFSPGSHVLELNCGTGEDACFLGDRGVAVTATDGSTGMLATAEGKVRARSLAVPVELRRLDLENPDAEFAPSSFDGAFSNFGGLNCIPELGPLAASLAYWLRPNASAFFVVMGPLCLWEIVYHLARLEPKQAFRRLDRKATARVAGESIPIAYPSPAFVARAFAPFFTVERLEGLGVVLPPSLWSKTMDEHRRLLHSLGALERVVRARWPFRYLGDHYLLELVRCP